MLSDERLKEALIYQSGQKIEKALEKYLSLAKSFPNDSALFNTIAGIYGLLGQPENQILYAEKASKLDKKSYKAHVNLGNGYLAKGEKQQALLQYLIAQEFAPKDPVVAASLGNWHESNGNIDRALHFYKKATDFDSKFLIAWFNKAAMEANLGNFETAKKDLNKVLSLDPSYEPATQMLKDVNEDLAKKKSIKNK